MSRLALTKCLRSCGRQDALPEQSVPVYAELRDGAGLDQGCEDRPAGGLDEGGDEPFRFALSDEIDAGETEAEATESHVRVIH